MQTFVVLDRLIIVDDIDMDRLCRIAWTFDQGYPRYKGHKMHWFVVGPAPEGMHTDHINRNKCDNRRSNLRFVTRSENIVNQKPFRGEDNKNIYKREGWYGIFSYQVSIRRNNILIHVGTFNSKESAIQARDAYIRAQTQK